MSYIATKETKYGVVIVDACDADLLGKTTSTKSTEGRCFYALVREDVHKYTRLHRIVLARVIGRDLERYEQVDHANNNGLDNRRANLRLATPSQNNANKLLCSTNSSGFKGVGWRKREGKWRAEIKVNQVKIHLGLFTDPAEAHEAYMTAARQYFGEFANDGKGGVK